MMTNSVGLCSSKLVSHSVVSGSLLITAFHITGEYKPEWDEITRASISLPVVLLSDTVLLVLRQHLKKVSK